MRGLLERAGSSPHHRKVGNIVDGKDTGIKENTDSFELEHASQDEIDYARHVTFTIQFYSGNELIKVNANLENLPKAVTAIGAYHRIISVVVDDGIEGPVWYYWKDEDTGISFRWCPRAGCGDIQVLNKEYEQLAMTFEELAWLLREIVGGTLEREKRLLDEHRVLKGRDR